MSSSGGETSAAGENPADKEKTDALYEDREPKKIIRIITVTAYMVSVSFVGIVLSAYYIFLWHPPNPRLMHAQAISAHPEARVDFLVDDGTASSVGGLARMAKPTLDDRKIDLHAAQPQLETLKKRREIVKNVNAILRANFEKTRPSETPLSQNVTKTMALPALNRSVITGSTQSLDNITNDSASTSESSFSTASIEATEPTSDSFTAIVESSSAETIVTSTTTVPPLRRTKSPARKQHQTPFALKHLEVPIKSDGSRKRPVRFTTTTMTTMRLPVSQDTRGTFYEKTTPIAPTTMESSQSPDNTSPQQSVKSMYKSLTTPVSQRDVDYPSSTDLPAMSSIFSDQFQAVPVRASSDDYRDGTIDPVDDLMDD